MKSNKIIQLFIFLLTIFITSCNTDENECEPQLWYLDSDGDSFGNPNNSQLLCIQPNGFVSDNTDCDDDNPNVNTAAIEIPCNGIDDNCNGEIDENTCEIGEICENGICVTATNYYADLDGDGFGDPNNSVVSGTMPDGYLTDNSDCNDNDSNINPNTLENPTNGIDDDCDGYIDEALQEIVHFEENFNDCGNWVEYIQLNNDDSTPNPNSNGSYAFFTCNSSLYSERLSQQYSNGSWDTVTSTISTSLDDYLPMDLTNYNIEIEFAKFSSSIFSGGGESESVHFYFSYNGDNGSVSISSPIFPYYTSPVNFPNGGLLNVKVNLLNQTYEVSYEGDNASPGGDLVSISPPSSNNTDSNIIQFSNSISSAGMNVYSFFESFEINSIKIYSLE